MLELSRGVCIRCLCTFVGVLGFRALVDSSTESADVRNRIRIMLGALGKHFGFRTPGYESWTDGEVRKPTKVILRNFSDLVVRIVPLTDAVLIGKEADIGL